MLKKVGRVNKINFEENKRKKLKNWEIFWIVAFIGLIIVIGEYIWLTNDDIRNVEKVSEKTILYLQKNIENYENTISENTTNSLDTLFDDYVINMNGIIVITDENKVVATNSKRLKNLKTEECYKIFNIKNFLELDKMVKIKTEDREWYGRGASVNKYKIYAFFPIKEVFATRRIVVFYSIGMVLIFLLLLAIIFYKGVDNNLSQLSKQYRIISATNTIYAVSILIDLNNDEWEATRITDRFLELAIDNCTASGFLNVIADEIICEDDSERYRNFIDLITIRKRLDNKDYISGDFKSNEDKWYNIIILPLNSYNGKEELNSVIMIFRDVTTESKREFEYQAQLQKLMEQEKRANSAKTDFLRRMSHDIRTPINGIMGMVEVSRHNIGNEEKQKECLDKIMDASGFLLNLINSVLDMNKLESGRIKLDKKPFDIKEIIDEIIPVLDIGAYENGIDINWGKNRDEHLRVIGSPLHLQQILQNIISNAIKYNKKNGTIKFDRTVLESDDEMVNVQFICEDTGIGMSEEFQKIAFEPFAQEDISVRPAYTGTGLGLAIVKELVDQMKGTITFFSEPAKGTTFIITIPFLIDKSQNEIKTYDKLEDVSIKGFNILVVEDNDLNMEIVTFLLENEGATVTKAKNGQEAVNIFAESDTETFDVILMDVMMPVMDGLEATRLIRNMKRKDALTVPVIAMTANAFTDDIELSIKAGMNKHFTKPLEINKLKNYIVKIK